MTTKLFRRSAPAELRDPVCGKLVTTNVHMQVRDGKTYFFCSKHCCSKFMPPPVDSKYVPRYARPGSLHASGGATRRQ